MTIIFSSYKLSSTHWFFQMFVFRLRSMEPVMLDDISVFNLPKHSFHACPVLNYLSYISCEPLFLLAR